MEAECLFCKFAAGVFRPDGLFWEDEYHMAFLAIDPNTEGFSVVIPKQHLPSDVLSLPSEALNALIAATQTVAKILELYFPDVGRVGVMMEGTGINHAHIKLMPMHGTAALKNGGWQSFESNEHPYFSEYPGFLSSAGGPTQATPQALQSLASALREQQSSQTLET